MSEEFDRLAAVLAELDSLEPGNVSKHAGMRVTARDGWLDMLETLANGVHGVYEADMVSLRSPQGIAGHVAGEMVAHRNDATLVNWFAMLDDAIVLTVADPERGTDDSTFAAAPGDLMRDVVRSAVRTVLEAAAARLIGYVEEVADQAEQKWDEEHSDDGGGDEGTE